MTALVPPPVAPPTRSEQAKLLLLFPLALAMAAVGLGDATVARGLIGFFGFAVFVVVAVNSRPLALTFVVGWLALLGFTRRALIPFAGWSNQDPLLLLSPAAAAVLLVAARSHKPPARTALSALAGFLLLWTGAQVLNPYEGSLIHAAQAALFYMTPLLWFFVGRRITRDEHDRVLTTALWMLVPVMALGTWHTMGNFLPFDLTWLHVSGQGAAVFLPGFRIRPFSTLVSPQEYGYYLSFASVILAARLLHRAGPYRFQQMVLVGSLTLLFFQASRSIFIFCLLAMVAVYLVKKRTALAFIGVGSALATVFVLTTVVSVAPPDETEATGSRSTWVLALHQISGLTNPGESTAGLHLELIQSGFTAGVRNPLGLGISAGSIVEDRENEDAGASAENDVASTTAALGIPAGAALLGFVIVGIGAAYRMERLDPSWRHLAVFGLGVAAINQWLSGTLYSTSTLLFLSMGVVAREVADRTSRARLPAPADADPPG